jgi:phosphotransferase system IIA component
MGVSASRAGRDNLIHLGLDTVKATSGFMVNTNQPPPPDTGVDTDWMC